MAAASLALASPFRLLLRAPHLRGAIPVPCYFISRGKPEGGRPINILSFDFASPLTLGPPEPGRYITAIAVAAARDSAVKGSADRNSAEEVRNILDLVICFFPFDY